MLKQSRSHTVSEAGNEVLENANATFFKKSGAKNLQRRKIAYPPQADRASRRFHESWIPFPSSKKKYKIREKKLIDEFC